jgi:hypothetical protein
MSLKRWTCVQFDLFWAYFIMFRVRAASLTRRERDVLELRTCKIMLETFLAKGGPEVLEINGEEIDVTVLLEITNERLEALSAAQ